MGGFYVQLDDDEDYSEELYRLLVISPRPRNLSIFNQIETLCWKGSTIAGSGRGTIGV